MTDAKGFDFTQFVPGHVHLRDLGKLVADESAPLWVVISTSSGPLFANSSASNGRFLGLVFGAS